MLDCFCGRHGSQASIRIAMTSRELSFRFQELLKPLFPRVFICPDAWRMKQCFGVHTCLLIWYIYPQALFCMLRHHFLLLDIAYGKRLYTMISGTWHWPFCGVHAKAWLYPQLLVIIYSLIPLVEYNNSPTNRKREDNDVHKSQRHVTRIPGYDPSNNKSLLRWEWTVDTSHVRFREVFPSCALGPADRAVEGAQLGVRPWWMDRRCGWLRAMKRRIVMCARSRRRRQGS